MPKNMAKKWPKNMAQNVIIGPDSPEAIQKRQNIAMNALKVTTVHQTVLGLYSKPF